MYGNDPSKLASVPQFGGMDADSFRRAQQQSSSAKERAPRQTPFWKLGMDLVDNEDNIVRFIPGQYDNEVFLPAENRLGLVQFPWLERTSHRVQAGQGNYEFICSAGGGRGRKALERPCTGCQRFWQEWSAKKEAKQNNQPAPPQTVNMRDWHIISTLDRGLYQLAPVMDWSTRQMRKNRDGQPFYEWYRTSTAQQQWLQAQGLVKESRYGNCAPLMLGTELWKNLVQYADDVLSTDCKSCNGRGTVMTRGYMCPNQQCNHVYVDVMQINRQLLPDEKLEFAAARLCPRCGVNAEPKRVNHCHACNNPVGATIFDSWINIRPIKTGSGQETRRNYQFLERWMTPIDPEFQDIAKPLDLKDFDPTPVAHQTR